jgi:hypothetical protein
VVESVEDDMTYEHLSAWKPTLGKDDSSLCLQVFAPEDVIKLIKMSLPKKAKFDEREGYIDLNPINWKDEDSLVRALAKDKIPFISILSLRLLYADAVDWVDGNEAQSSAAVGNNGDALRIEIRSDAPLVPIQPDSRGRPSVRAEDLGRIRTWFQIAYQTQKLLGNPSIALLGTVNTEDITEPF